VKSVEEFSISIGMTPMFVVLMFKSTNFLANKARIQKLCKSLTSLIKEESWVEKQNGEKLKQRTNQIGIVVKILLTFSVYGASMCSLVAFFDHELPLKMWFPYDSQSNEFLFWLTVFYQVSGGIFMTPIAIFLDVAPVVFMSYLAGIMEELCERIGRICEFKRSRRSSESIAMKLETIKRLQNMENYEEFVKCVKIHQKLLEISTNMNEIFGKDIWFQGFVSIFVLCTTSFSLTIVSRNPFFVLKLSSFPL
jgi:hypothetical protein